MQRSSGRVSSSLILSTASDSDITPNANSRIEIEEGKDPHRKQDQCGHKLARTSSIYPSFRLPFTTMRPTQQCTCLTLILLALLAGATLIHHLWSSSDLCKSAEVVKGAMMSNGTASWQGLEPTVRGHFNKLREASKDAIVSMWTMATPEHRQFAKEAVNKINDNNVEGDIVECGVWMGGMTMLMVFQNMKQDTTRQFWLFDTFEGLPEPSHEKDDPRAKAMYSEINTGQKTDKIMSYEERMTLIDGKWNYGPLDIVMNNLRYTGYPQEHFHFIQGKVEDTLPITTLPDKIAILRLDTDWYLSTKMELDYMYDRLQSGGVLIVDDFCAWEGSKNAVEEYFKEKLNLDANEISEERPCLVYWKP